MKKVILSVAVMALALVGICNPSASPAATRTPASQRRR